MANGEGIEDERENVIGRSRENEGGPIGEIEKTLTSIEGDNEENPGEREKVR